MFFWALGKYRIAYVEEVTPEPEKLGSQRASPILGDVLPLVIDFHVQGLKSSASRRRLKTLSQKTLLPFLDRVCFIATWVSVGLKSLPFLSLTLT